MQLLTNLLQRDPIKRPSVHEVIKFAWFTRLESANMKVLQSTLRGIPEAVPVVATLPPFVRLALVALCRELPVGAKDAACILYQELELQCNGSLTLPALNTVARNHLQGPVALIAE